MTNLEIAELLRTIAAAYQILGENRFRIMAYEKAADSVEHLTSELKDVWDNGKLDEVPGIGTHIASALDELFRTGKVKHFGEVLSKVPASVFPLLLVPGIGPKKAYRLVKEFHLSDPKTVVVDLEKLAKAGKIAPLEGFGEKSQEVILESIATFKRGAIKENRMVLPEADSIAQKVMEYLKAIPETLRADTLGSLRRQVSTIGDIDIAVATKQPEKVIDRFLAYPHQKIIDHGPAGATLLLHNGRQVDLRVQKPGAYGAMLQYFTGSKHHNITLRSLAQSQGLSLNEYGIKDVKTGKVKMFSTEEAFYAYLKLPWIAPELREDRGEVETAKADTLPRLVQLKDIKGDLHMHAKFDFPSSHDIGASPLSDHLDTAMKLGYEYIGISDHNPSMTTQSEKQIVAVMKRRKEYYEQQYYSWQKKNRNRVHLLLMCEVDILPDGNIALPNEAFEYIDAAIISIHSSFTQERNVVTERIIKALTMHPKVRILGHPTGRLLTKREGVDADWHKVFEVCKAHDIALEINSYFDRLDLPDDLVRDAVGVGIKLCIDTDSHAAPQMELMRYGVAVARRGWATKDDIINTREYNVFKQWLTNGR